MKHVVLVILMVQAMCQTITGLSANGSGKIQINNLAAGIYNDIIVIKTSDGCSSSEDVDIYFICHRRTNSKFRQLHPIQAPVQEQMAV